MSASQHPNDRFNLLHIPSLFKRREIIKKNIPLKNIKEKGIKICTLSSKQLSDRLERQSNG